MSLFYCHECDFICDADDGCAEGPGNTLICEGCCAEAEEAADRRRMISVGGKRDGGSAA